MLAALSGILATVRNSRAALGALASVPISLSESPNTARAKSIQTAPLSLTQSANAALSRTVVTAPLSLTQSANAALGTTVVTTPLNLSPSPNAATGTSVVTAPLTLSQPGSGGTVVLHLHFDGAEGSTTFTDSSPSAHVPLTVATPLSITNVGSKFGGSGNFTGGYIQYADSEDWNYGSGDFTIEFWANWNSASIGSRSIVFGQGSTNGGQDPAGITKNTDESLTFSGSFDTGLSFSVTSSSKITANTWYHVAGVRSGTNFYLWINGTLAGSAAASGTLVNSPSVLGAGIDGAFVSAGYGGVSGTRMMGMLDEFRITKGAARYTAPFTPPTTPF